MDKVGHGLSNRGERHGMGKLLTDQVLAIRARCARGELQYKVSREYGVCRQTVSDIVCRRTWEWLP
jgi:hypothetical protein